MVVQNINNAQRWSEMENIHHDRLAGTALGVSIRSIFQALGGGTLTDETCDIIDPGIEDAHWQCEMPDCAYYEPDYTYEDDYAPAYGFGYVTRQYYFDENFPDVQEELGENWRQVRGTSRLSWEQARAAVADAWKRYDILDRRARGITPMASVDELND